jgi:hypothetical protein
MPARKVALVALVALALGCWVVRVERKLGALAAGYGALDAGFGALQVDPSGLVVHAETMRKAQEARAPEGAQESAPEPPPR